MEKAKTSEYEKKLEIRAKKFKLNADDMHNLFDLGLMIPAWFVNQVLKPNKMDKWFWKFFERIDKVVDL